MLSLFSQKFFILILRQSPAKFHPIADLGMRNIKSAIRIPHSELKKAYPDCRVSLLTAFTEFD